VETKDYVVFGINFISWFVLKLLRKKNKKNEWIWIPFFCILSYILFK